MRRYLLRVHVRFCLLLLIVPPLGNIRLGYWIILPTWHNKGHPCGPQPTSLRELQPVLMPCSSGKPPQPLHQVQQQRGALGFAESSDSAAMLPGSAEPMLLVIVLEVCSSIVLSLPSSSSLCDALSLLYAHARTSR